MRCPLPFRFPRPLRRLAEGGSNPLKGNGHLILTFNHMPLGNILPTLPWDFFDVIMNVVAGLGAILLTYAIFLEAERRQDAILVIGSACLLVYALWLGNTIFSVAMAGVMVASFIELLEIMTGRHVHSTDMVEDYKNPKGK